MSIVYGVEFLIIDVILFVKFNVMVIDLGYDDEDYGFDNNVEYYVEMFD